MIFKARYSQVFFIIALLVVVFQAGTALMAGDILGRVTDSERGTFLQGANVQIEGTNYGAAADRFGVYRILRVPPGRYTLVATFIGYERYTVEVSAGAGDAETTQDIAMTMTSVIFDAVVVEGQREGQMKALSQQRTSPNIKNVVAQEQMERFPDVNTAEVLQRIPGVFIQRSQGDGRYAFVRGTAPGLSLVTVNGEKLATNRVEERYAQLDIIAASQLASVEVVKAITPDMDGDAIGGSINLVTRSPFDATGTHFSLSGGPGYAQLDGKLIGEGKFNFSTQFGANKTLGWEFNANYDTQERGTDGMEFSFAEKSDVNGNPIPFALDEFDLRNYRRTKTRYGFGTGLEFKPNENHSWFIRGLYSRLNDEQARGRWRVRVGSGNYLTPDGTLTERSRFATSNEYRTEQLSNIQLSLGGAHHLKGVQVDYTGAFSFANEEHPDQLAAEFALDSRVNLQLDLDAPKFPKWTVTNQDTGYEYDPSHYTLDQMDYRETYARNWKYMGSVNLQMPFGAHMLKGGLKYQRDKKNRDEDRWRLRWRGDKVTLDTWTEDQKDEKFMNDNYVMGPEVSKDKLFQFFDDNIDKEGGLERELRYWDSEGQHYLDFEDIIAYYLMTTLNVNKFKFLLGVRHEFTIGDYQGTVLELDNDGNMASLKDSTVEKKYNNFLPMAHVTWKLSPMTNVRFAFTSTIARPNWWYVTPYFYLEPGGEAMEKGNPDLKPTTSMNLDIMFEHYFQKVGVAAAGFFYKDLKDIIYEQESKVVGGVYDDYELVMAINGGDAKLLGFELAWNQELSFLPGFLSGFGIYTNYTHTWANTEITDREGFLPGQSGDVGNFSVYYDKYGFSVRFSAMYQDKYLTVIGKNKDWDQWMDKHLQYDFSAAYDVFPWLQVYVNGVNLSNVPSLEYYGIADRPRVHEFYSWWLKGGIKINR